MPGTNLTRDEAQQRAALLSVDSYEIDLDLSGAQEGGTYRSVTTVRFDVAENGATSFIDLVAPTVHEVTLNGDALDPAEEAALRGPSGCLAWCLDVQDWRWSSRGVRDRAIRLARLFPLEPAAVVIDPTSGYSCLMARLGARRQGPALLRETLDGYGRGTQADPPIP